MHVRVHQAAQRISRAAIRGVIDVVPAEAMVLVTFDARGLNDAHAEQEVLSALLTSRVDETGDAVNLIEVPVCYEPECAPDLADVANLLAMSVREVVTLHTSAEYIVKFVGFVPGFAYLTGLPAQLHVPRLDSPRPRVAAGSVAIAGDQAGVYPSDVPGGWRLIGRTPVLMFDATRERPALLSHGDRVKFVEIDATDFHKLAHQHKEHR